MADNTPVKLSYLNKSYREIREELLAKAPIVSGGVWTDINSAEILVAMLELLLGVNDMNNFYFDHATNEAFFDRSNERKNVISHCSSISYRLSSWAPAIGSVTIKLNAAQSGYIYIPKYSELISIAGLSYYCNQSAYLTNDSPVTTLSVAQGIPNRITYTSNGLADQQYIIPSKFVAEGSVSVTIKSSEWEYVDDSFAKSGPFSEHYILFLDSNNSMYVIFGDGVIGTIPPEESVITIEWADTLGPAGNVRANQIKDFKERIENVVIMNSSEFSGGSQPETIEEAKKLAPMLLRATWKGVNRDDFIALTEKFPGVRQASVLDINDFPLYSFAVSYHEVIIVAIPQEGEYLSEQYKLELLQYLEERKYVTANISLQDPDYVSVDIEAAIYKYKNYDERVILANIQQALEDFFVIATSPVATYRLTGKVDGVVLGGDIRYSVLVSLIQSIEGVAYVNLVTPSGDVSMNNKQIPVLGELKLSIADISDYVIGNYASS